MGFHEVVRSLHKKLFHFCHMEQKKERKNAHFKNKQEQNYTVICVKHKYVPIVAHKRNNSLVRHKAGISDVIIN